MMAAAINGGLFNNLHIADYLLTEKLYYGRAFYLGFFYYYEY